MKVVHFVVSREFGGVEGHICTLIHILQDSSYEFEIICDSSIADIFREKLQSLQVKIHAMKLWPQPGLKGFFKLVTLLKQIQPDILHCHLYCATRIGAPAGKIAGVPKVVETIHIEENWRKGFNKLFYKVDWLIGTLCVDKYLAVSHAVEDFYVRSKGISQEKISVVHNAVTEKGVKEVIPRKGLHLGFMGRLVPQKGASFLIEALAQLRQSGHNYTLSIAGDGPLRQELEALVLEKGLDKVVTFLGNISDKKAFFSSIDLFVLPSHFEGFPLVLLEAGLHGVPVVATQVSGNPEIIKEKESGLLIADGDSEAIAKAVLKMEDSDLRNSCAMTLHSMVTGPFSSREYFMKMVVFYTSLQK